MKKYICSICSFTYDEAVGMPDEGIPAGTKWEDIPDDWKCPICGADKWAFEEKKEEAAPVKVQAEKPHIDMELSAMELSVICSNLARGCEKQYLEEQKEAFLRLSEFFRGRADEQELSGTEDLLALIEKDLNKAYPYGNRVAKENGDRGALRCQVWSEKVSRMLQSLLTRYKAEGDKMLENTGVFVCTVCGFVYVGDEAPRLCPVCKVPTWKFEKVNGRV